MTTQERSDFNNLLKALTEAVKALQAATFALQNHTITLVPYTPYTPPVIEPTRNPDTYPYPYLAVTLGDGSQLTGAPGHYQVYNSTEQVPAVNSISCER